MTWQATKDTALLIVDPQKGFCPGGNLAVAEGDQIMPVINTLRSHFGTVVISQDYHPAGHISFASSHPGKKPFEMIELDYGMQMLWPDHCVRGTADADFHDDLMVMGSDLIIRKGTNPNIDSYSAFYENDRKTQPRFEDGKTLTETLQAMGIKKLVIVGLAFDYCVGWTALDAVKDGFEAVVLADATRAIAPDSTASMKKELAAAGVMVVNSSKLPGLLAQPKAGGEQPKPNME